MNSDHDANGINKRRFFEKLDRINLAVQKADNLEAMMQKVLDEVLAIFDCDRAFLLYPCDPDVDSWTIPMERTRPEYSDAGIVKTKIPMDSKVAETFRMLLDRKGVLKCDLATNQTLPKDVSERFGIGSFMATALHPKFGKPWEFGIHQCSHDRVWTSEEEWLLLEIGHRLADGLTSLLIMRDLKESEAKYRRFVETSIEGIWALDASHRTTFINARTLEMLGRTEQEMIGRPLTDFMFEEDIADHEQRMATRRQGISEQYERRFIHKDGSELWGLVSAKALKDGEGAFQGSFAMFTDITERKQTEQRMALLDRALNESSDAIYLMDGTSTRFNFVNDTACRALSYSREELLAMSPPDIDPDVSDKVTKELTKQVVEGRQLSFETRHQAKDGRIFPVEIRASAFEYDGKMYSLAAVRDITERKEAEDRVALLSFALNSVHEGAFLTDAEGKFHFVNEEACLSLDYSREELLNMSVKDIDPEWSEEVWAEVWEQTSEPISTTFETTHKTKGGHVFPVEINANLFNYAGKEYGLALVRDISERRELEKEQQESQQRLQRFIANLPAFFFTFKQNEDGSFCFPYASPGIRELYGLEPEDVQEDMAPLHMLAHPDDRSYIEESIAKAFRDLAPFHIEYRICRPGMPERWVEARSISHEEADGSILWYGIMLDTTERKQAEEKLLRSEQRLRLHTELSPLGFLEWDENFRAIEWNAACEKIFGYRREEALGRHAKDLILPAEVRDLVDGIYRDLMNQRGGTHSINENITRDGHTITVEWFNTTLVDNDGKAIGVASVCRDITELNKRRQQVYQLAYYDTLTELPNRELLRERLQQALDQASRQGDQVGLIQIHLGRLREVNDALGHQTGDRLLRLAAERVQQCIRDSDTAARLGGGEFAILLPDLPRGEDSAQEIAASIKAALDAPFVLTELGMFISCSIGIALFPQNGADGDTLLKHAYSAMHFAKQAGHDDIRFYSKEITDNINQSLLLESELYHALEREELELYYQPKVLLDDGRLIGSEALIRWNHPERGLIPPDRFIPIAEKSGLILEIGSWVLWEACHTALQWNGQNKPLHKVAVNLSPHQFLVGNLPETVERILVETGCNPAWLELEITESLLLDKDDNVRQLLQSLRDMGLSIAIDDFGTGYSSLSYLANFPINVLKIDRSFTMHATEGGYHAELIRAVCTIAQSLNQTVVAEGVETEAQAAILRTFGCHIAQGYLYGKPVRKAIFEQFDGWKA